MWAFFSVRHAKLKPNYVAKNCTAKFCQRALLFASLLIAVAGLDTGAHRGEQVLGGLGVFAFGSKLKIFAKGLDGAGRGDHFVVAAKAGLREQVDPLLVIGLGASGIGGNGFVEGLIGRLAMALIGEEGALVEIAEAPLGRIELGGLLALTQGGIHFPLLGEGQGQAGVIDTQRLGPGGRERNGAAVGFFGLRKPLIENERVG